LHNDASQKNDKHQGVSTLQVSTSAYCLLSLSIGNRRVPS